jgi:hypothetical protein
LIYLQSEHNPTTVLRRDHAFRILPIVRALAATLFLGRLHQDGYEHCLVQSKNGANSFGLYLADGRSFHFRGASTHEHYDAILVYDRWTYTRDGVEPVATLRTVEEAEAWAGKLRFNPLIARRNGRPTSWPGQDVA